jgi:hypothetical protein
MDPTNSPFARSWVDQTPPALLVNDADRDGNHDNQFFGLGHYMLPNCASFKVEWALDPRSLFVDGRLDGVTETLWFDPGDEGDGTAGNPPDPLRALHARIDALQVQITATPAAQRQPLEDAQKQLCSLLYDRICLTTNCDLTCSDPEVLLGTVFSLAERVEGVRFNQQNANCRSLGFSAIHANCGWPAAALALDRRMNLAIFTSGRPGLRDDLNGDGGIDDKDYDYVNTIPDPMFPAALRITVDVYDNRGRLDRPIRHVMVIPIGS